eukprot:gnl/MRDRNA2_/MRDRNA2_95672_c0_seq1.p1 gnl/MRDRNA2_/MRDRNA2_95672_c0~~gnl/MRDRNA2_/MRDRNA2_95672_c0_seq1.p1  ORF type:complete len:1132 (-),score=226.74 gnl/MRDRNA2_/MRDRNA2_95672_c0_seq1:199-3351(-)
MEGNSGKFGMSVKITLQYSSSFPQEGMVVWLKKHQQLINDAGTAELVLVETAFEDWVDGRWIPISADVRYAEEAEALVQAVITSDSGQTAGRVKSEGAVEDAKLGPVGEKGRIILSYYCSNAYSYAEMGFPVSEGRTLVPVGLQLPWSSIDNPANNCPIAIRVRAPQGSRLLDVDSNILAYRDFVKSLQEASAEVRAGPFGAPPPQKCQVIVPEQMQSANGWQFATQHLPPKPSLVMFWVSVADADSGWELMDALPAQTHVSLKKPDDADAALLQAHLPGGQTGYLMRCQVDTEAAGRQPGSVKVHTDITISDASGSTGMTKNGKAVRSHFNAHEERRVLTRLEAIPKIAAAGVLLPNDIWRQHFIVFDHGCKDEFLLETRVGDLDINTVTLLIKALTSQPESAAACTQLTNEGKQGLLTSWQTAFCRLRGITPGGATSFAAGANKAREAYTTFVGTLSNRPEVGRTAYVNFDTDGGNNSGPCYDAIRSLVKECDVVQGAVLGIGSWVDQHCASEVAKILQGPANLSMNFPENIAAETHFRQDLSRWIKTLRTEPVSLTVSAGATNWVARQGQRSENGVDVLFARGEGLKFGTPDVSELSYSKGRIEGLNAGESVVLYLLSRRPLPDLASTLTLDVNGVLARVSIGPESMRGITLANDWLSLLGGQNLENVAENKASLCRRLRQRIEDDMSFNWNVPTKSGSTAATGRAKTQTRKSVPLSQQPAEPKVPEVSLPVRSDDIVFGGGAPRGAPQMQQQCLFGAPAAAPCSASFGAAPAWGGGMMMGGMGGAPPPPAPPAAAAAMAAPMGGGFGGGSWGGGSGAGLWGAPGGAPMGGYGSGGGLFGGGPPMGGKGGGANRGGGLFGSANREAQPQVSGPQPPSKLLQATGSMRWGPPDQDPKLSRSVQALRILAGSLAGATQPPNAGQSPHEDPLVAAVLGGPVPTLNSSVIHHGFTCDATHVNPIVGTRYKSANSLDVDLCVEARRGGNFAHANGFIPVLDPATAMRYALGTVLCWWPLLWPDRGDLFAAQVNLAMMNEQQLRQAIMRLPES